MIGAEHNPWYILATLYGVPKKAEFLSEIEELQNKNRCMWNRYYATFLNDQQRNFILKQNSMLNPFELTSLTPGEQTDLRKLFSKRSAANPSLFLPSQDQSINLCNVEFDCGVNFRKYIFPFDTNFSGSRFYEEAIFFEALFLSRVNFRKAVFFKAAQFNNAYFFNDLLFENVIVSGDVWFSVANFSGTTTFKNTKFDRDSRFNDATFSGYVTFDTVSFAQLADLSCASFASEVDFVNAKFHHITFFINAQFLAEPPKFFGATLHEGTNWQGVKWPNNPICPSNYEIDFGYSLVTDRFILAYERMKLEMDRLKKHEDELNFFALEMQCRRVKAGYWAGLPIAFYGAVCDYGRDYAQPLWLLALTIWIGAQAAMLTYQKELGGALGCVGFSIASTFGALGLRKEFFDSNLLHEMPRSLMTISAGQTFAGIIFLFFFGLAVRNRFRMK